jgi:hypothetical protein
VVIGTVNVVTETVNVVIEGTRQIVVVTVMIGEIEVVTVVAHVIPSTKFTHRDQSLAGDNGMLACAPTYSHIVYVVQ